MTFTDGVNQPESQVSLSEHCTDQVGRIAYVTSQQHHAPDQDARAHNEQRQPHHQPEDRTADRHGADAQLLFHLASQRILFLQQPLSNGPGHQATKHGKQHHGIETGDLAIPELPCRYQQQIMLNRARALLIPT